MTNLRAFTVALAVLFFHIHAFANATAASDKAGAGYTLFNPTPREKMRDMDTDRPHLAESPHSVDAGHVMVESELFTYAHNKTTNTTTNVRSTEKELAYMTTNIKIGLTNSSDIQFIVSPSVRRENTATGEKLSGAGDTLIRFKQNVIGNDHGEFALGLLPMVNVPTAAKGLGSKKAEYALAIPMAVEVKEGWEFEFMPQYDRTSSDNSDTMIDQWTLAIASVHDVTENLGLWVELASTGSDEEFSCILSNGVTYMIGKNIQLDAGSWIPLTKNTTDITAFTGLSFLY